MELEVPHCILNKAVLALSQLVFGSLPVLALNFETRINRVKRHVRNRTS